MIRKFYRNEHMDVYKKRVIRDMIQNGWTIDRTAKHFGHGWATIEKWLNKYGSLAPEDLDKTPEQAGVNFHIDTHKCLECLKLQAKLEMMESLYQDALSRLTKGSA